MTKNKLVLGCYLLSK